MDTEIDPEVAPYRKAESPISPMFLNRWSPRAFLSEPIDDETLWSVFEAARWAASSTNEQPWRFVLARSESDRAKFVEFLAAGNQVWAKTAPVLVLILAKKTFTLNGQPNFVHQFDAGTCSGYMTLQAHLHGLIAHGMGGFDRDKARAVLEIPDDFDLMAVYAIGKRGDKAALPQALQEREVPSGRRAVHESVMEGRFPSAADVRQKEG